jgi:uncharacterized protein YfeS
VVTERVLDLCIFTRSYNTYGGTPEFKVIEALFAEVGEKFGPAVREIDFVLCLRSRSGVEPFPSLEDLFENHHKQVLTGPPLRKFHRKKALLEITTSVDFLDAQDLIPEEKAEFQERWTLYNYDRQIAVGQLLVGELEACKPRFKRSDEFDFPNFIEWARALPTRIPREKAQADVLVRDLEKRRRYRFEQLSPWERLGVDWDEFHPRAKELVPDHRLWSSTDDFSPNGNDTGADVLAIVQENASGPALRADEGRAFYRATWEEWGFSWPPAQHPSANIEYNTHREFVVGLAFAFLKVLGKCPPWLRASALDEIAKYRAFLEASAAGWEHLQEAMTMLALMHSTLSAE